MATTEGVAAARLASSSSRVSNQLGYAAARGDDSVIRHTFPASSIRPTSTISTARLFETIERQKGELARFVSPEVAELVSSDEGARLLAGHRAYITIVYFDLRGFTALSEAAKRAVASRTPAPAPRAVRPAPEPVPL